MKLLGISGSPSKESKTSIAVTTAVEHATSMYPDLTGEVVRLRDYEMQFCDGREPDLYVGDTQLVIQKVLSADHLIFGTPVYRGSYTGILKNLFDVLPNDALEGKVVGIVATGGTDHHFLAIEQELKPVLGFFYAHIVPGCVYANNSHFGPSGIMDSGIVERLQELSTAVVECGARLPRDVLGATRPSIPRKSLEES